MQPARTPPTWLCTLPLIFWLLLGTLPRSAKANKGTYRRTFARVFRLHVSYGRCMARSAIYRDDFVVVVVLVVVVLVVHSNYSLYQLGHVGNRSVIPGTIGI